MKHRILPMLLLGASLVATSCIDNDEPQGLQHMREAKAELLSADASVQRAEAQLRQAQAATEQAVARYNEALAEAKELENAIQAARDDKEKQELQLELERLAEAQKAALYQLQAATANWESEYHKALTDLQVTLATYAGSKYAGELQTVVGKLQTSRGVLSGLRNQIVRKQGELFTFLQRDSLTINRLLRYTADQAQQAYDLGQEKLALLKEAREGNLKQWSAQRDEAQERIDALLAKSEEVSAQANEARNKYITAYASYLGQKYLLDGDRQNYLTYEADYPIDHSLDAARTLTFAVPEALTERVMDYLGNTDYDPVCENNTVSIELDGLEPALRFLAQDAEGEYDAFASDAVLSGLIPDVEAWGTLSENDLSHARQMQAQLTAAAAAAKATYESDLAAYRTARNRFLAAAQAYGWDYTGVNSAQENRLWYKTKQAVTAFYEAYDAKVAEDATYEPTASELKTLAAKIADYLVKRVALTDEYALDPLTAELDPVNKPGEYVKVSAALADASALGDAYRKTYFLAAANAAGRTVMGNSENLSFSHTRINPVTQKADGTLALLAAATTDLYGIRINNSLPILVNDLLPEQLKISATDDNPAYTDIPYNSYTIALKAPIENLPSVDSWGYGSLTRLTDGSLYDHLTARERVSDMTAVIDGQGQAGVLAATLRAVRTDLLKICTDVRTAMEQAETEADAAEDAYYAFAYAHSIDPADGIYTLAEQEKDYLDNIVRMLDGFINSAEITLSDGSKYNVTADIDREIETAEKAVKETTPGGLYEQLEQAKADLAAWKELGYAAFNRQMLSNYGAQLRAEIAELEKQVAEEQANFDYWTGIKDNLIASIKAE